MTVHEALPAQRRAVEAALGERGLQWPPGRTFVTGDPSQSGEWSGFARLVDPPPGDGLHREHVRNLVADASDGDALTGVVAAALTAAGPACRIEAELAGTAARDVEAWLAGGLVLEGRWPDGWRNLDGSTSDVLVLGRPAQGCRAVARDASRVTAATAEWLAATVVAGGPEHRAALAAFVAELVPGRAYPPGALLSESERNETRRAGALDAEWLLALDGGGTVLAGLVFERERRVGRSHVRRIHLDVLARARGRGLATALVRAAREGLAPRGVERLEADPREGNAGACRALAAGGLREVGRQRCAWRMRTSLPSDGGPSRWDEDVRLFAAAVERRG